MIHKLEKSPIKSTGMVGLTKDPVITVDGELGC